MRLKVEDTVLVVIDVQGNLAMGMPNRETLFRNLRILIEGSRELNVPIILTEQVPTKLGETIGEIREVLPGVPALEKSAFSCCGCEMFRRELKGTGRRTVVLAGMETHVCVYQTAIDLIAEGYRVEIVSDAVSSRKEENKRVALERMQRAGVQITSVEMVLFELMRTAENPVFRNVAKLVK